MEVRWYTNMDKREIGQWIISEANKSYRYWHSSPACRRVLNTPFFDKNQCKIILEAYTEIEPKEIA